jgi:hypothetical protein
MEKYLMSQLRFNSIDLTTLFYESGIYEGIEEILCSEPFVDMTEDELRIFFSIIHENLTDLLNTRIGLPEKVEVIDGKAKDIPEPKDIPDLTFSTVNVGE